MFLEEVIQSEGADWDLAMLAYHLYGDKMKCVDGQKNIWKVFSQMEDGNTRKTV